MPIIDKTARKEYNRSQYQNNKMNKDLRNKFENGKIYCITCKSTGYKYFGSTCQTIEERLAIHVKGYKYWKKGTTRYVTSYYIIDKGNYFIELVELFSCYTLIELETQESLYINSNECINIRGNNKYKIIVEVMEHKQSVIPVKLKEQQHAYYLKRKELKNTSSDPITIEIQIINTYKECLILQRTHNELDYCN